MNNDRHVIRDGAVAIDGNRIVAVGKTETVEKHHVGDVTIVAQNKAVLPGFVNVHTHAATTYLKGVTEDMPEALHRVLWPIKQFLNERIVNEMGMLGLIELVKSGSTTVAENYNMIRNGIAPAVEEIGVRAVLSEQVFDADLFKVDRGIGDGFYSYAQDIGHRTLREATAVVDQWNGKADGRIKCMIGPLATDVCSKEILERAREEAEKRGVGLTIHLSQSPVENRQVNLKYGKTPVQYLQDIGFLGSDLVATHCIYTNSVDTEILSQTDTRIAHCPSNMVIRGADRVAPLLNWLRSGIVFGLGTDNPPSPHDMLTAIRNMKTVAWRNITANHYNVELAKFNPSPAKALEIGTIGGAKALRLDREIGSLEVGKKADLIIVDLHRAHIGPTRNHIIANLVYYACGSDVETVIVDGRIIKEDGSIKSVSEEEAVLRAQEANRKLWSSFLEANPNLRDNAVT
jgi:5-methylthioadenosine/S-adenosylhomocysteine deaminase